MLPVLLILQQQLERLFEQTIPFLCREQPVLFFLVCIGVSQTIVIGAYRHLLYRSVFFGVPPPSTCPGIWIGFHHSNLPIITIHSSIAPSFFKASLQTGFCINVSTLYILSPVISLNISSDSVFWGGVVLFVCLFVCFKFVRSLKCM